MDPATAMQVANAAFAIADTTFAAGKQLHMFVKKVKKIEDTAREFEREIKALGEACHLVGTSVRRILVEQAVQTEKGQSETLFTCLEQQLGDCRRSIDQLEDAIGCADVKKVNGSSCFVRAILQLRLDAKAGDVEAARNLIRSHTSSLQITLLGIAINVSYVIPKRVDANLRQQLDQIACKREELEQLRSERTVEEDLRQNRNEDTILAVSDKVLSSGRTLCGDSLDGESLKRESIFGKANFISGWIQDANALDSLASPTFTAETDTPSVFSAGQQRPPSSFTEDSVYTGRAGHGSSTSPGDEYTRAITEELDSDDEFAIQAAEHAIRDGSVAFEKQDFEEASESLQEALKMVRELPTSRQTTYDSFHIRYMLGVCAFHLDPPPVAKEALISIVESTPRTTELSNGTSLQLQAGHLLAQTYIKLGELEQARSTCNSTLKVRLHDLGKEDEAYLESLALMATIEQLQGHASRAKVYSRMLPGDKRQNLLNSFSHLTRSIGGLTGLSFGTAPARAAQMRTVTEPHIDSKYAAGARPISPRSESSSTLVMTPEDVSPQINKVGEPAVASFESRHLKKTHDVDSRWEACQSTDESPASHPPSTAYLPRGTLHVDGEEAQERKTSFGSMQVHASPVDEQSTTPCKTTSKGATAQSIRTSGVTTAGDLKILSSRSTLSSLEDISEKEKTFLDLKSSSNSLTKGRGRDSVSSIIGPTSDELEVEGYRNEALRNLALSCHYVKPEPAEVSARKNWVRMLFGYEGNRMEANAVSTYREGNMSSLYFDNGRQVSIIDTLEPLPKALVFRMKPDEMISQHIKKRSRSKVFASITLNQLNIWSSPLHLAALFGDLKAVKALLEAGTKAKKTCDSGTTALHCAAMGGHCDVVKVLIEAGCPTNVESPTYGTALALAVIGERLDVIDVLVRRDADLQGHLRSFGTIAHLACMTGNLGLVKSLFKTKELLTIPSKVAPQRYHECRLLVMGHESTVQVEDRSRKLEHYRQITPLAIAAYMGHANIVAYLISLTCDASVRSGDGRSAVDYARDSGKRDVVDLLRKSS